MGSTMPKATASWRLTSLMLSTNLVENIVLQPFVTLCLLFPHEKHSLNARASTNSRLLLGNHVYSIFLITSRLCSRIFVLERNLVGLHFWWMKLQAMVTSAIWRWLMRLLGYVNVMDELASIKMGQSLEVAYAIRQVICDQKVHIGQEIFVVAFARNGETDYGVQPVLLMPTYKKGTFHDAALIMEMLWQAWKLSPYGEALHHAIWSIASDGDPKWHPALYLHCMVCELTPTDPLYQHVGKLQGMNLYTGIDGMMQDLDIKHDLKHKYIILSQVSFFFILIWTQYQQGICKTLSTCESILINTTVINKSLLASWLKHLTNEDWSENFIYSLLNLTFSVTNAIQTLISPKDPQDVPRAVKLSKLLAKIHNLNTSDFNPSEHTTHQALSLLGELVDALIEPFTNPEFSISEQIINLVKVAHIACALFLKHEGTFLPPHLYSDLQSVVQTSILQVAHTKNLDWVKGFSLLAWQWCTWGSLWACMDDWQRPFQQNMASKLTLRRFFKTGICLVLIWWDQKGESILV